ncbi:hypothetical protein PENSOL_c097G05563 [Penicillium solitum]|uniref:Major facilitator superfamily (MFS) profile domain-containing protein n=1 Tax=Penicillium solitum TaxID=60172 RepID=A0A1V6Q8M8_9EURO|nr:uncharacterized protein PENSOL_c097G05563 [Penicillium solitum]OQD85593.1 hypothetical protein PENSOL_c097G05563 [Penicillium solitum]
MSIDASEGKLDTVHAENVTNIQIDECSEKIHAKFRHRIDRRLLPLCAWLYLMNYLDRSNIGNAKILNQETGDSLLQRTGMTAETYSITITIFSVAYSIFDVPSNWVLKRYCRPSYWLSFLALGWGALTLGFAWADNVSAVIAIRFFIGVFEAGFFPAAWYRPEERAFRICIVSSSATLAGCFGGCIAYGMAFLNGKGNLAGYQWLFIVEGIITILCTGLIIAFMPNFPDTAKWLSEEEKDFAQRRLGEQSISFTSEPASRGEIIETCVGPRMIAHYCTYLSNVIVVSSLVYFCPTIVAGLGYTSIEAQMMTVPPWALGYVMCLSLAWVADHYNQRGIIVIVTSIGSGAAFLATTLLPLTAYRVKYACLIISCCGVFSNIAPLTSWVICNMPSPRVVGLAAALNNAMVGIGSTFALWIWKDSEKATGYPTGNIVCAACSFLTAVLAFGLRWTYTRMNRMNTLDSAGIARDWKL